MRTSDVAQEDKMIAHLISSGIKFLNGSNEIIYKNIPVMIFKYNENPNGPFKNDTIKFWFKLENNFWKIHTQLKKELKEISIWFDSDNEKKILEILK